MELLVKTYEVIDVYIGLFLVFSLMGFLSRGRTALKWSWDHLKSGFASLGVLYFNLFFGGIFLVLYVGVVNVYGALNVPTIPKHVWETLPAPISWIALLLVYDICLYWVHRWLHGGWRWPMHAVHHSDTELNFMSWSRGHAIEQGFIASAVLLGSSWLGLSFKDVAVLAMIKAFHQYYVHSNIDWDHGPLKKIIVSPQYHRWHHADKREAWDKNFASIFPFLDIIWGTYYYPHSAVNTPTGFEGTPRNDLVKLICYPFVEWYKMIQIHFAKKSMLSGHQDVYHKNPVSDRN